MVDLLTETFEPLFVLGLATGLDYAIGDPWTWLHPVQVIGWGIHRYSQFCLQRIQQPLALRIAGIGLFLLTLGLTGGLSWLIIYAADLLHPVLGFVVQAVMLASCFAGRSLRQAAEDVLCPLEQGDLEAARFKLSRYVGRDTQNLPASEILRAVLETVTENATDGVMAPLFYAIIGAFLPIGSAPLALMYKAASTLDSMVGYRDPPYKDLGWCSARVEDGLTWLPCRLHVLTLALWSGRLPQIWQICRRDAIKDPSPNSGWSECAYAAILQVQVGGSNWYGGRLKVKPLLGDPNEPITAAKIEQAMQLTRQCFLLWLVIAGGCLALWLRQRP